MKGGQITTSTSRVFFIESESCCASFSVLGLHFQLATIKVFPCSKVLACFLLVLSNSQVKKRSKKRTWRLKYPETDSSSERIKTTGKILPITEIKKADQTGK